MGTKGCHTMLEALAFMKYRGQVFIAGELDESKYLRLLRKLSEGLNVHFLGFVEPLSVLLALIERAELFIFPSETEGMSLMLLEVASIGTPIIASNIPENTSVFKGTEVLYFEVKNKADLAEKVTYALQNKSEMKAMASKSREKVLNEYNWSTVAITYANLYNQMTSSR